MSKLTKILLGVAVVYLAVAVGIAVFRSAPEQPESRSGELFNLTVHTTDQGVLDDDRVYGTADRTATSTAQDKGSMTFLDAGTTATTSFQFLSERASSIDLNWFVVASSTSSKIHICNEFSNNGIDWYAEVGQQTNSVTEGTVGSPFCREWTAGVTATSTFNTAITPVASKYTRVNFRATGADVGVIIQAVLKELYN